MIQDDYTPNTILDWVSLLLFIFYGGVIVLEVSYWAVDILFMLHILKHGAGHIW